MGRSRRVSRVATLDGEALLLDYGFSHADSTFDLEVLFSEDKSKQLNRMVQLYAKLVIATRGGLFLGAIKSTKVEKNVIYINFLVEKEIA